MTPSTEVDSAVGEAPERAAKDKTIDVVKLLNQKRQALALARDKYQNAREMRDEQGMSDSARVIDALKEIIPELEAEVADKLEAAGKSKAKGWLRQNVGELSNVGERIVAQQAVISEKIAEAVAEIAKEVDLWMSIEKFGQADQILSARFGLPRSDPALSLPNLRDWATPVLTITDSMRPNRRKPQGVVISNTASDTPEQRRRNALKAVAAFMQSKGQVKTLPVAVQAILAEAPIHPDVLQSPQERAHREASAATIGTGRGDPALTQAAAEVAALPPGVSAGMAHVHRG